MKKLRWQLILVALTLVVVSVLLLTQQPGETQVFSPLPASGGVYTEGLIGGLSRLNPLLDLNNPADRDIDRLLFSGLLRFDDKGLPMPDLAESWGVSQDGTIYNLSLRANAVWHDGQPVTSQDVLFTIDLLKDEASFFPADVREMWKQVQIKALNDKLIQFVLPEPFAPFLDYLTFGVLPKHLLEGVSAAEMAASPFNLAPIGSGPYQFKRLIVENGQAAGVELSANATYYGGAPYIETVIFRYYPSAQAALAAYRAGDVLGVSEITLDVLNQALAEPNLAVYSGRLPEMSLILFNLNDPQTPFLADAALRRALLLGLNRQRMVNQFLFGQAIVADGPIFPGTWAYYENIEHLDYDPQAALSLLKANGYAIPASGGSLRADKDGKLLQFTLLHPDDALHTALAQSIQQNWSKLGVEITLQALPYEQLVNDRLKNRNYQAALVEISLARTPDPDPYPFWHQSEAANGQNYSQWDNRAASEFLEQARITSNLEDRARLYRNFQVIFAQENPALPLYYPVYTYAVDQQVLGVQVPPLFDTSDRFLTFPFWHLLTRRGAGTSQ